MSFIGGICRFGGAAVGEGALTDMAAALGALAPDRLDKQKFGAAAFVRGLYALLPEDRYDAQPYISSRRRIVFVADARLDNRSELADLLHIPAGSSLSDSELLFRLYEARGAELFDVSCGDFAVAVWDEAKQELTLGRDITGQRPLHYFLSEECVAFASTPHGLLALDQVPPHLDRQQIAEFFADIPRSGSRTFFQHVKRVQPGEIVQISAAGVTSRSYWSGPKHFLRFGRDEDYVDGLRERLNAAVRSRLRGAGKTVGAHLSAGLDSGAVASTAAILMKEEQGQVLALTAAPRHGFDGPGLRQRVSDESYLAGLVAELYSNVEHVVVRGEGVSPLDIIKRDSGLFGEPLGLPCNQVWVAALDDAAQAAGMRVVLTGESGNYALTSGSVGVLSEFTRRAAFGTLIKEGRQLHGRGLRWRGIAAAAFGPWVPKDAWRAIQRWHWGPSTSSQGYLLLRPSARALLGPAAEQYSRSARPLANQQAWRAGLLQAADPGLFKKGTLAGWGFDERDVTVDRRLIEYCLAMPPEQLLRNGVTRSLARRALSDRLPPQIIDGPRGYQGADWFERVDSNALLQELEELGRRIDSDDMVDLDAMRELSRNWPAAGWETGSVISQYRMGLLRAISAARFVAEFTDPSRVSALRQRGSAASERSNPLRGVSDEPV